MALESEIVVELTHIQGYEFNVKFGLENVPDLLLDEPEPLGTQQGPNASRILAAAIANCLSASLIMCLNKARIASNGMKTVARTRLVRNEEKRLRVSKVDVEIELPATISNNGRMDRCFGLFEQFCIVTASVRQGIPVSVSISSDGKTLFTQS
ncbi:MAG: OsmC family protein [Gammaproteobacteria bacterium]|nr:OsmC family protein [Gammaproteobacteria bacterium]